MELTKPNFWCRAIYSPQSIGKYFLTANLDTKLAECLTSNFRVPWILRTFFLKFLACAKALTKYERPKMKRVARQ